MNPGHQDDQPGPASAANGGRLADNILYFARTLRGAGLRVGPAAVVEAVRAVGLAGITRREDFYWTLHSTFVSRHEDHPVFHEAFALFWRPRELVEKMLQMFSPMADPREREDERRAGQTRVSQSLFADREDRREPDLQRLEIDAVLTASEREVLHSKDFAQMSADELAAARRAIARLVLPVEAVKTRRFEPTSKIARIDARRMLGHATRTGGDLVIPKFRRRRTIHPPIVVLADISGSMAQYSRMFLHFLHALTEDRRRVHTFLFGTRLTNVTRQLRMRDPDEAIELCSHAVEDWSGGTRVGATLGEFNRRWARRVLGQGAIVLLMSDGLERDGDEELAREIDRLHRSCRRLIWLNPLLRFEGFEPRAAGVRAMLPHVDEFRPIHSLDAMSDLCGALGKANARQYDPRNWMQHRAA